jgi:hypothetical protein
MPQVSRLQELATAMFARPIANIRHQLQDRERQRERCCEHEVVGQLVQHQEHQR